MTTRINVILAAVAGALLWGAAAATLQAKGPASGPPPSTPPGGPNTGQAAGTPSNTLNNPNGPTVTYPSYGGGYGTFGPTTIGPNSPNPPYDPGNSQDQNPPSLSSPGDQNAAPIAPPANPPAPTPAPAPDVNAALKNSPEMQAAESALRAAENDYDLASAAATKSLAANPSYQAALTRQSNARAELHMLQGRGDATPESIADAAGRVLAASTEVHDIEGKALAADPHVADLKSRLAQAAADRDRVRGDVIASLTAKPAQP